MPKWLLFAVLIGLQTAPPAGSEGGIEEGILHETIIDTFGFVPEYAWLNGVQVPVSESQIPMIRGPAARVSPELRIQDVGVGISGHPCTLPAVLVAIAESEDGVPRDALLTTIVGGVSGQTSCGLGFPYVHGVAQGQATDAATEFYACIIQGAWFNSDAPCYDGGFGSATLAGRVGHVDILIVSGLRTLHIEYLFAGSPGWGETLVGQLDEGAIVLES